MVYLMGSCFHWMLLTGWIGLNKKQTYKQKKETTQLLIKGASEFSKKLK